MYDVDMSWVDRVTQASDHARQGLAEALRAEGGEPGLVE